MDNHDDMNDLKRYVQNHPNNRMAWYLLGKQYVQEGKEAKANYCFLQSGSVYDAYERKQHPLANEPKQMIAAWNRKRGRRFLALRTGGAAAILLALMLAISPGGPKDEADPGDPAAEPATLSSGLAPAPGQAAAPAGPEVVVVKPADGAGGLLDQALGALLGGAARPREGLAAALEPAGAWRLWTGKTRLLAQTARQGRGGAEVAMLDARACACEPADASAARAIYARWSARQEQSWTLASAIAHYRERTKRWPTSLADLVRPYPENTLSGTTKEMKAMFEPLLRAMKEEAAASADPANGEANAASGVPDGGDAAKSAASAAGAPAPLPAGPLAIVVDKDAHRLAVVSGDVIVRSYPVGLGGARTPEGGFVVREKVRSPKGRTPGEFGTRGMALSDTAYAIHGTNDADSIGKDESHGCIRMARQDIEELYDLVPLGTRVTIKSGALPAASAPAAGRFRLQPAEDETNPAVVYEWLD
ncbi:Lipoprotein-anchoring transpeptidase ErfK/SrfK [Paenibacillus sp. UNC496MF]|uniref:L,D-transpeptidase n=1 Tax=Paenibacillus sp. UNC496MF TaxID=1502753 RepID=UPI0008ED24BD|nr:L,D-transpeptidase [Paenibacillus sp. UNC496MF]SFI26788.1 Lipoprotein-anchoring transpeptidase ErfK/SrfK [Paenibacillus sp. UNC496MF]